MDLNEVFYDIFQCSYGSRNPSPEHGQQMYDQIKNDPQCVAALLDLMEKATYDELARFFYAIMLAQQVRLHKEGTMEVGEFLTRIMNFLEKEQVNKISRKVADVLCEFCDENAEISYLNYAADAMQEPTAEKVRCAVYALLATSVYEREDLIELYTQVTRAGLELPDCPEAFSLGFTIYVLGVADVCYEVWDQSIEKAILSDGQDEIVAFLVNLQISAIEEEAYFANSFSLIDMYSRHLDKGISYTTKRHFFRAIEACLKDEGVLEEIEEESAKFLITTCFKAAIDNTCLIDPLIESQIDIFDGIALLANRFFELIWTCINDGIKAANSCPAALLMLAGVFENAHSLLLPALPSLVQLFSPLLQTESLLIREATAAVISSMAMNMSEEIDRYLVPLTASLLASLKEAFSVEVSSALFNVIRKCRSADRIFEEVALTLLDLLDGANKQQPYELLKTLAELIRGTSFGVLKSQFGTLMETMLSLVNMGFVESGIEVISALSEQCVETFAPWASKYIGLIVKLIEQNDSSTYTLLTQLHNAIETYPKAARSYAEFFFQKLAGIAAQLPKENEIMDDDEEFVFDEDDDDREKLLPTLVLMIFAQLYKNNEDIEPNFGPFVEMLKCWRFIPKLAIGQLLRACDALIEIAPVEMLETMALYIAGIASSQLNAKVTASCFMVCSQIIPNLTEESDGIQEIGSAILIFIKQPSKSRRIWDSLGELLYSLLQHRNPTNVSILEQVLPALLTVTAAAPTPVRALACFANLVDREPEFFRKSPLIDDLLQQALEKAKLEMEDAFYVFSVLASKAQSRMSSHLEEIMHTIWNVLVSPKSQSPLLSQRCVGALSSIVLNSADSFNPIEPGMVPLILSKMPAKVDPTENLELYDLYLFMYKRFNKQPTSAFLGALIRLLCQDNELIGGVLMDSSTYQELLSIGKFFSKSSSFGQACREITGNDQTMINTLAKRLGIE